MSSVHPLLSRTAGAARRVGDLLFFACLVGACTPADLQLDSKLLTGSQEACSDAELAASLIPPGTPASVVTTDVGIGCDIDAVAAPALEKKVNAKLAALAEAGSPLDAGTVYRPGPQSLAKIRARVAALGIVDAGTE